MVAVVGACCGWEMGEGTEENHGEGGGQQFIAIHCNSYLTIGLQQQMI